MQNELNGVVVIDKPAGMTSAKVVAEVKKALGAAKVGHTGTLDPFATGVLVCCINQATRLARFFLQGEKRYEALLRLGTTTDTLDITGQVITQNAVPEIPERDLAVVFGRFLGPQLQQPPAFSALKHHGTPLYKLARRGNPMQKPPRPVTIDALQIRAMALPDVRFEVLCSAGTYVRVLCADIGQTIGCGGHLAELRRTASCGFDIEEAMPLEAFKRMNKAECALKLIPMTAALRGMPALQADTEVLRHLSHGRPLNAGHIPVHGVQRNAPGASQGLLKVVDDHDRLRAVLQWSPERDAYNYCCVFN